MSHKTQKHEKQTAKDEKIVQKTGNLPKIIRWDMK